MDAEQPNYAAFLAAKSQMGGDHGFAPTFLPDYLFDFQGHLVEWAVRKGRGALFADCGLGKTVCELVWADNVVRRTNQPVLLLTPLGVAAQTVREAEKFGVECRRHGGAGPGGAKVVVCNYERLHHLDRHDFAGVVCDESSVLKNFQGVRRAAVTEFLKKMPCRLLCSATPAPNDFTELGTTSEALGELGHQDMLSRFFKNDEKTIFLLGTKYGDLSQKGWRFKPHSERAFWRWVCSWARACRRPSDLGFDDTRFVLPELVTREHTVAAPAAPGHLFPVVPESLKEQQAEVKRTIRERCEKVAELVADHDRSIAWCHLNAEGDLLKELIPDCVQVSGADSDEAKEEAFLAFASGQIPRLVTKPKCGGFGLNWQHCAHQTFFPSHSYQDWYQCVRRSWRFGQTRPVIVDVVTTEGLAGVLGNLRRKQLAAEEMFANLVALMHDSLAIGRSSYGTVGLEAPSWL